MNFIKGDWIYDIETYPNIFTFCAVYANGGGIRVFEISDRKNETEALLDFLRKVDTNKHRLVGFNNVGFDYPVVHHIIQKAKEAKKSKTQLVITANELYGKAMEIIKSSSDERWGNTVKESEVVIKQVDLYKIHHFDNKARATSLKMLEFNMRSENIEDLPYPVGTCLNDEEKDVLIEYNKHDVMQTLKFYKESIEAIQFRSMLSEKFGFDCTNYNDTKIGKEYFINRLEKAKPECCYKKGKFGKREIQQTKRDVIHLKDVILPYVSFERKEFVALLQWIKSQSITETKGVFTDLLEKDVGDVALYAEMVTKKRKYKTTPTHEEVLADNALNEKSWVEDVALKSKKGAKSYWRCWNELECMNVVVDGFRLDFGTGGIHGSVSGRTLHTKDDWVIVDWDVSSYYPNLAIANGISPKHLGGTFCKIYSDVYESRKSYAKGTPENAVMKLALNGVYGDSNNPYSPFYDPQYTMAITINGQLSLCMLIEKFLATGKMKLIQANTDGVTLHVHKDVLDEADAIVKWWEGITGLEMEKNVYSMMAIRDVNNYTAVYQKDGKIKQKGAYEYKNLGWNKNFSSLVIPMAVEQEIVYGKSAEDFIRAHKDKFDFMLRTKVPRSSRLVMVMDDGTEVAQQNICRYYPCVNGGKLVKIMPPLEGKEEAGERRLSIDSEWKVRTCNDITKFEWDIDYEYYIQEARKLIDAVKGE